MIRKLTEADHRETMEFLGEEPAMNLFIIGDLEAFGYENDFQELWGDFDQNGDLQAVLLRFHNSFIPYSKQEDKIQPEIFAEIMKSYPEPITLSGKSHIVEKFEGIDGLRLGRKQVTYFAECTTTEHFGNTEMNVKTAGIEDINRILELRGSIEEFVPNPNAGRMMEDAMKTQTGRVYYLEKDGMMAASAGTAAENSLSAMIVGVCSLKEYRGQGLATAVMQKLFNDVMGEGKVLCLFYDNPVAGRIYKRLGFKDIGMWTMYR